MAITGLEEVIRNLRKEINLIEGRTVKSLIKSAVFIQRSMEFSSPLTPVEYGNLRSSYFIATPYEVIPTKPFVGPDAPKIQSRSSEIVSKYAGKSQKTEKKLSVHFGFSAYYAMKVHELAGEDVKWTRPASGPFFFEASIKRNSRKILNLIKSEAEIK